MGFEWNLRGRIDGIRARGSSDDNQSGALLLADYYVKLSGAPSYSTAGDDRGSHIGPHSPESCAFVMA